MAGVLVSVATRTGSAYRIDDGDRSPGRCRLDLDSRGSTPGADGSCCAVGAAASPCTMARMEVVAERLLSVHSGDLEERRSSAGGRWAARRVIARSACWVVRARARRAPRMVGAHPSRSWPRWACCPADGVSVYMRSALAPTRDGVPVRVRPSAAHPVVVEAADRRVVRPVEGACCAERRRRTEAADDVHADAHADADTVTGEVHEGLSRESASAADSRTPRPSVTGRHLTVDSALKS